MYTERESIKLFMNQHYAPKEIPKALFKREVLVLFEAYRKWYLQTHYNRPATGVTIKLFTKWLRNMKIILLSKSNKQPVKL